MRSFRRKSTKSTVSVRILRVGLCSSVSPATRNLPPPGRPVDLCRAHGRALTRPTGGADAHGDELLQGKRARVPRLSTRPGWLPMAGAMALVLLVYASWQLFRWPPIDRTLVG